MARAGARRSARVAGIFRVEWCAQAAQKTLAIIISPCVTTDKGQEEAPVSYTPGVYIHSVDEEVKAWTRTLEASVGGEEAAVAGRAAAALRSVALDAKQHVR